MAELPISDVEAFQGAASVEAGDVEVIAYSGGNLPVVEQGQPTVALVDTSDTEIDPAEQDTLESVLTELQGSLDVSAVTVPVEQQTAVQLADATDTTISPAEDSTVQDVVNELQNALDVSGATVTVTDDGSLNIAGTVTVTEASTLAVEQQTPVGVEDSTGTQVDPATENTLADVLTELQSALDVSGATVTTTTDAADAGPVTARTTSTSTTVSVAPGRFGDETAVHVDASGSGTLTVGVSTDGGTTVDERTLSYDSTGLLETVPGFGYVEASANQNLNALSLSAKGL
jgi:citrate lyase gamma subunit